MKKKLGKETDSIVEIKKEKQDDDVRFFKTCLAKEIRKLFIHPMLQAQSFQSKYSLKQAVMSSLMCIQIHFCAMYMYTYTTFFFTNKGTLFSFLDTRRLEVCCNGGRSSSVICVFHSYNSRYHWHINGRSPHFRICGSRQNHRHLSRQISSYQASNKTTTLYKKKQRSNNKKKKKKRKQRECKRKQ